MRVSIVTPTLNSESTIRDTIESVLSSSISVEYIIVDGGSTDDTLKIVNEYKENISFVVSEPDKGIYDAMNKGIDLSNGDIVGIINSDDYYINDAIRVAHDFMNKNPNTMILHSNIILDNGRTIKPASKSIKYDMIYNHPTYFVRRSVYSGRKYNIAIKLASDYDFTLECISSGVHFSYLDVDSVFMRIGGASSDYLTITRELFGIQKKYFGLFNALMVSHIRLARYILKFVFGKRS